jgi:hypothetical protein
MTYTDAELQAILEQAKRERDCALAKADAEAALASLNATAKEAVLQELELRVKAIEDLLQILMEHLHWASVTNAERMGQRWNRVLTELQRDVAALATLEE